MRDTCGVLIAGPGVPGGDRRATGDKEVSCRVPGSAPHIAECGARAVASTVTDLHSLHGGFATRGG